MYEYNNYVQSFKLYSFILSSLVTSLNATVFTSIAYVPIIHTREIIGACQVLVYKLSYVITFNKNIGKKFIQKICPRIQKIGYSIKYPSPVL